MNKKEESRQSSMKQLKTQKESERGEVVEYSVASQCLPKLFLKI